MTQFRRRQFLKASLIATAGVGLWPASAADKEPKRKSPLFARADVPGANSEIRYAVVGFGGRGRDHIKGMREVKGTRLVALCDVDNEILQKELKACENLGEHVAGYTDVRKLLENKDIDVVTFATPNHWHALGSIWAIQAGKDGYVEKP